MKANYARRSILQQLKRVGVYLLSQPEGMSRRRRNRTCVVRDAAGGEPRLSWFVELVFLGGGDGGRKDGEDEEPHAVVHDLDALRGDLSLADSIV